VKSRWSLQSHVFEGSPQNVVLSDAFCCLPQKSAVSCDLTVALQMFSDTAAAVKHGGVSRSPLPARDQPQGCRRSADGSRLPSRSWGGRGGSRGGQSRALYPRVRPLAPRRSTGPMATPAASCERGGSLPNRWQLRLRGSEPPREPWAACVEASCGASGEPCGSSSL